MLKPPRLSFIDLYVLDELIYDGVVPYHSLGLDLETVRFPEVLRNLGSIESQCLAQGGLPTD